MNFNIYNRRKELGLTLEAIGKHVGVSKSTVKKWESGSIENMKRDKIGLLAEILKVSPLDILGFEDEKAELSAAPPKPSTVEYDDDPPVFRSNRPNGYGIFMYEKDGRAIFEEFPPEDYAYLLQTIEMLKKKRKNT